MSTKVFEGKIASDFIPQDNQIQQTMRERAQVLAKKVIIEDENQQMIQYICFCVGENDHYGISYQYAANVIAHPFLTIVPRTPSYIAGIINHRGALISVLDLKQFLYHEKANETNETNIILVKTNKITLGILTNKIIGDDGYESKKLDASILTNKIVKPQYILGLDKGINAIINMEEIANDLRRSS